MFNIACLNIYCYNIISIFTEKNLMVLNDGRTLIGYLRSIDQFGLFKFIYTFYYHYSRFNNVYQLHINITSRY